MRRLPFTTTLAAFAALALLAPAGAARGQGVEDVHAILPAAGEAGFRGRKVVIDFTRATPQVTTLSVLRQPGGRERREFLSARGGVFITDGAVSWQYLPERGIVVRRPVLAEESAEVLRPDQVRRALASYEVRGTPAESVAGRRSRVIEFRPRQAGSRPVRKVWIDADTGLILRSSIYSLEGRLSWLSVFESLEYRPPLEPEAFVMRPPAGVRTVEADADPCVGEEEAVRVSGLPLVLPAYLPAGFARTCIHARRRHDYGELQVLYSDGLSLLSLFSSTRFREPGGAAAAVAVGPWFGRWHEFGLVTGVSWRTPWAHLALLGEISRGELLKVAAAVRPPRELSAPAARP